MAGRCRGSPACRCTTAFNRANREPLDGFDRVLGRVLLHAVPPPPRSAQAAAQLHADVDRVHVALQRELPHFGSWWSVNSLNTGAEHVARSSRRQLPRPPSACGPRHQPVGARRRWPARDQVPACNSKPFTVRLPSSVMTSSPEMDRTRRLAYGSRRCSSPSTARNANRSDFWGRYQHVCPFPANSRRATECGVPAGSSSEPRQA